MKKPSRRSVEHRIQKAICELLHYALPPDAMFWAVPNGGSRSKITAKNGKTFSLEAKRLKDEGVTAGVADLHILWGGRLICLEVKTPNGPDSTKGYQSEAQRNWETRIVACGGIYRTVRGVDEVKELLDLLGCHKPQRLGTQENDIDAFLNGQGDTGGSERMPAK